MKYMNGLNWFPLKSMTKSCHCQGHLNSLQIIWHPPPPPPPPPSPPSPLSPQPHPIFPSPLLVEYMMLFTSTQELYTSKCIAETHNILKCNVLTVSLTWPWPWFMTLTAYKLWRAVMLLITQDYKLQYCKIRSYSQWSWCNHSFQSSCDLDLRNIMLIKHL